MCGSPQPWCGAGTLPGASTHTHSHTHTVLPRSLRRTAASSTFVVIFLWSRRRCRRHAMQSPLCRPLVFPAAVGECRPAHMHTHTQVHSAPTMHTNTHLTPEESPQNTQNTRFARCGVPRGRFPLFYVVTTAEISDFPRFRGKSTVPGCCHRPAHATFVQAHEKGTLAPNPSRCSPSEGPARKWSPTAAVR